MALVLTGMQVHYVVYEGHDTHLHKWVRCAVGS